MPTKYPKDWASDVDDNRSDGSRDEMNVDGKDDAVISIDDSSVVESMSRGDSSLLVCILDAQ